MPDRPGRLGSSDAQLWAQAGAAWGRRCEALAPLDAAAKFVTDDLPVFSPDDSGHKVASGLFQVVHGRLATESELANMLDVNDGALIKVTYEDVKSFLYGALRMRKAGLRCNSTGHCAS